MVPADFLNYGALGLAMAVLMLAVAVLFRVLVWARGVLELVLERFEDNTTALVRLSERLHGSGEEVK